MEVRLKKKQDVVCILLQYLQLFVFPTIVVFLIKQIWEAHENKYIFTHHFVEKDGHLRQKQENRQMSPTSPLEGEQEIIFTEYLAD